MAVPPQVGAVASAATVADRTVGADAWVAAAPMNAATTNVVVNGARSANRRRGSRIGSSNRS
jgi:hypothetical protein